VEVAQQESKLVSNATDHIGCSALLDFTGILTKLCIWARTWEMENNGLGPFIIFEKSGIGFPHV